MEELCAENGWWSVELATAKVAEGALSMRFLEVIIGSWGSRSVTYDQKALVIDGKRRILQSGSFHYPRTTPEMWPEIIRKSKEGT
ncbi:hypothetical protein RJ639_020101 [Escallonia herrerae]|uniref:beta-galactosidase n=1 Tax=Escallonia herrerae TaxID=1293975 RepID=A0AA88V6F7_9ASTE|nr:hypothetical protein RJ639_020101 [Escallonia herrerae]